MSNHCQALVERSDGSWFDFSGCLMHPTHSVDVVDSDFKSFTVSVCNIHGKMLTERKELVVDNGARIGDVNVPGIAAVTLAVYEREEEV